MSYTIYPDGSDPLSIGPTDTSQQPIIELDITSAVKTVYVSIAMLTAEGGVPADALTRPPTIKVYIDGVWQNPTGTGGFVPNGYTKHGSVTPDYGDLLNLEIGTKTASAAMYEPDGGGVYALIFT